MEDKVCCITGHRNIPAEKIWEVNQQLRQEILDAISQEYKIFLSGFAEECDLMFAAAVSEEKACGLEVSLEAALPYRGRLKTRNPDFHRLIRQCDRVYIVNELYTRSCFEQRNRFMVDRAQRVIAVYDGRKRGGTFFTLQYAQKQGKEIRLISI